MEEKGQVFTFDALFALMLMGMVLFTLAQASDQILSQTRGYITRQSLEQQVNDTADILVKTPGSPTNWEYETSKLETPGLAKVSDYGEHVQNFIDSDKFSALIRELKAGNWNSDDEPEKSIKEFFGGTNNFEIELMREGEKMWSVWPGWTEGGDSQAEKAAEVTTVKRLVYGTMGDVRAESPPLVRVKGGVGGGYGVENLKFRIYSGDLDAFDWYIYLISLSKEDWGGEANIKIWVNNDAQTGSFDYGPIHQADLPLARPGADGGMDAKLVEEQINFIDVKLTGIPERAIKIYIVGVQPGTPWENVYAHTEEAPFTLNLKIWR